MDEVITVTSLKQKKQKMKKLKIFLLSGFAVFSLAAQAQQTECNSNPKENFGSDEAECRKCISLYSENLKQGNYVDGLKYWRCTYKICPEFKPSLYTNGQIMYKHFIDNEKDAAVKDKLIDTLQGLYEQQIKIFGPCPEYYESYGAAMLKYRQSKPEISNDAYTKYFEIKKEEGTGSAAYGYYTSLYLLYRAKKVDCNKMVDEYLRINGYLDVSCKDIPDDANCKLARETMDKYAAGCLGCDKLIEIYTKKFESLPADKDAQLKELNKMSDMLSKKECSGDLVDKIAEKMYELAPDHKAAYALAVSNASKNKNADALKWVKEAIELCGDCEETLKYKLFAAKLSGTSGTASSYAQEIINSDKTGEYKCEAYLILARCKAANQCGDNDFQRKFAYCLALDYLDRAKAAGCTNTGSLYASYSASCPTSTEAFTYGKKEGDAISSCGEATKLRLAK
jgi:hypothetical protein